MEKYRKFEDESNGINPFIPDSIKKRNFPNNLLYFIQLIFGTFKAAIFITLYLFFVVLQVTRHFLIAKKAKRTVEVCLCKVFGRVFLYLLGVYNIEEKSGKVDNRRVPNLFFSSQSSIIDWVVLMYRHAPNFLWIVKSTDSKNDKFVELSYLNVLFFGLGLKFLQVSDKNFKDFNIQKYMIQDFQTPLVIFPEATKTNRKGVLSIRSNLMDEIYDFVNEHRNFLIRSEIIVKKFAHYSPSNTTDKLGLITLIKTCSQIYNNAQVVIQDIPNDNFFKEGLNKGNYKSVEEYIDNNLQNHLYEPASRNIVK